MASRSSRSTVYDTAILHIYAVLYAPRALYCIIGKNTVNCKRRTVVSRFPKHWPLYTFWLFDSHFYTVGRVLILIQVRVWSKMCCIIDLKPTKPKGFLTYVFLTVGRGLNNVTGTSLQVLLKNPYYHHPLRRVGYLWQYQLGSSFDSCLFDSISFDSGIQALEVVESCLFKWKGTSLLKLFTK